MEAKHTGWQLVLIFLALMSCQPGETVVAADLEKDCEKTGEVNEVCFVEGLVYFNDRWYLCYGTGDSNLAVAVSEHRPI